VNKLPLPTKDELYAKALEIFMQEMYVKGMHDVPTPEYEELLEGNYVERARAELMKSPEKRAWEEELKGLELAISQLEEARQKQIEGVPAGVEVAPETLRKLLEIYNDLKMREDQLRELRSKRRKEAEEAKKRIADLESQMAKAREEVKKKPAIKVRILQNFKEGLQYFRKGDVIETHNIDWVLAKIDQKLAERVGVEVPVKVIPEVPPRVEVPKIPEDRVRVLTDRFISMLSRNGVTIRPEYRARLRDELPTILGAVTLEEQLKLTEQLAMEIVNEYRAKVEAARRAHEVVPTVPFGREREEIERVEEVAPPKLKPPAAALWRWLFDTFYSKRWRKVEDGWITEEGLFVADEWGAIRREVERLFGHLPKDEQEALLAQYRAYLPRFKYPDITTFLKEVHKMTIDDFAKLSNEDRKKIWEEFYRSETL
jgi:hypothetical protein